MSRLEHSELIMGPFENLTNLGPDPLYVDDECEPTYVWCQGKVVELVMQTDIESVVKIEWNETCLQHGDPKITKHVLKKSKWNLTAKDAWKTNGAWRQDLLHLIK